MIQKAVSKRNLLNFSEVEDNLAYWLLKTPKERLAVVEHLRKQRHGGAARPEKAVCIIQRLQMGRTGK
jgi:hypothetical protein